MQLSSALCLTYSAQVSIASASSRYMRPSLARMGSVPSFPSQIALVGEISDRFRLAQPITLNLEQEESGKMIASDDIFFMYGEGVSRQDALRDYVSSLSEYYELLEGHQDAASVNLFKHLQSYLHPIQGR